MFDPGRRDIAGTKPPDQDDEDQTGIRALPPDVKAGALHAGATGSKVPASRANLHPSTRCRPGVAKVATHKKSSASVRGRRRGRRNTTRCARPMTAPKKQPHDSR